MNVFRIIRIPDLATLTNAILGVSAMFMAVMGYFQVAILLILVACIADGLDGFLAIHLENSPIGKYLDSLADAISFGVAPIVIIFTMYGLEYTYMIIPILLFYVICGILRLARFDNKESEILDFEGVPITASAVMLSTYLLMNPKYIHPYVLMFILLLLSILMITTYPYPKFRNIKVLVPIFILFVSLIVTTILFQELGYILATILFILMVLYLESPIMKIPRQYYRD
ncbi:archaetidylserine synthase [Methanosalsum natronophilum]|uniref:archaetidylserine synthase n=1 Tax=Methanosalsum natronophilum TaxID=768733 RepID=UPI00216A9DC8|nr:archaetidylserine synthase [Methanosalsum natronophilum]MCS3923717.1 CDP-diacylglycerol--serine O-phosphatidyltransferase [Methanosalsum natronophilum]